MQALPGCLNESSVWRWPLCEGDNLSIEKCWGVRETCILDFHACVRVGCLYTSFCSLYFLWYSLEIISKLFLCKTQKRFDEEGRRYWSEFVNTNIQFRNFVQQFNPCLPSRVFCSRRLRLNVVRCAYQLHYNGTTVTVLGLTKANCFKDVIFSDQKY
jgi:hypothetical protein